MRLDKKAIVVTGASSGMGKAIVETFVREGANVVAVARRKERLEALAKSLEDAPGKVIIFPGDIGEKSTNEAMIDICVKEFGRFDVLVNNAGVMDDMSPIGDVKDERYEHVMRINVYGPMCAMRKAVEVFLEQGDGGNIINNASAGAFRTLAGAVYCASKAALVSMSKNTAYMYIPNKIRCNVIAPGGIVTEIASSMGDVNTTGYARLQNVYACAPAHGSVDEIAASALFLASDESSYVNGAVLAVDGGWLAG